MPGLLETNLSHNQEAITRSLVSIRLPGYAVSGECQAIPCYGTFRPATYCLARRVP